MPRSPGQRRNKWVAIRLDRYERDHGPLDPIERERVRAELRLAFDRR